MGSIWRRELKVFSLTCNNPAQEEQNCLSEESDESLVYDHDIKANMFWQAFRERLGTTKGRNLTFPLQDLFQQNIDLSSIEEPFTHEEIDMVVKNLPTNKSREPDGFNTNFIRKC